MHITSGLHVTPMRKLEKYRKSKDSQGTTEKLIEQYREKFANPYIAAERGYIDNIIKPHETRYQLICGLELLSTKIDHNPKKKN